MLLPRNRDTMYISSRNRENTCLYLFGFNTWGIIIAYVMGYALIGFTTFVTILGRYDNQYHDKKGKGIRE